MCGIFGVIYHNKPEESYQPRVHLLINALATASVSRGRDAVGLARLRLKAKPDIVRITRAAYDGVRTRDWNKLLEEYDPNIRLLMGHTRAGTHGGNTLDNTHPFLFEIGDKAVVGTHNGVINNHREFKPDRPFENDSANFIYRLSRTPSNRWGELLFKVQGSLAMVVAVNNTVHVMRNTGSPLVWCEVQALNAWVYASTEHILRSSLAIAQLEHTKIDALTPGKLFTMKYGTTKVRNSVFETYCRNITPTYTSPSQPTVSKVDAINTSKDWLALRLGDSYRVHALPGKLCCWECKKVSEFKVIRLINKHYVCDTCIQDKVAVTLLSIQSCEGCKLTTKHAGGSPMECQPCFQKRMGIGAVQPVPEVKVTEVVPDKSIDEPDDYCRSCNLTEDRCKATRCGEMVDTPPEPGVALECAYCGTPTGPFWTIHELQMSLLCGECYEAYSTGNLFTGCN